MPRGILRWVVCGRGENEREGCLGWRFLHQIERGILEREGDQVLIELLAVATYGCHNK